MLEGILCFIGSCWSKCHE